MHEGSELGAGNFEVRAEFVLGDALGDVLIGHPQHRFVEVVGGGDVDESDGAEVARTRALGGEAAPAVVVLAAALDGSLESQPERWTVGAVAAVAVDASDLEGSVGSVHGDEGIGDALPDSFLQD